MRYRLAVAAVLALSACAKHADDAPPCRSSFELCGGMCVPIDFDAANCGACGVVCPLSRACVSGQCVTPNAPLQVVTVVGEGAGGSGDSAGAGADGGGGGAGGGGVGSGGASASAGGDSAGGKAGTQGYAGKAGASGQGGAGGAAVASCDPPLSLCDTMCFDLSSDDSHCGTCTTKCSTGTCSEGACVGAVTGHQILFAADFTESDTSLQKVLGNAAFLGSINTGGYWRILAFDPYKSPSANDVDAVLAAQAPQRGITNLKITRTTTAPTFSTTLSGKKFDAVLIYDQPGAPKDALGQAGAQVGAALGAYATKGGVILVLASGKGQAEMWALVEQASLFPTTGFETLPKSALLDQYAPFDPLLTGVPVGLAAPPSAGAWTLPKGPWNVVLAEHATGRPVVVHDVLGGPLGLTTGRVWQPISARAGRWAPRASARGAPICVVRAAISSFDQCSAFRGP